MTGATAGAGLWQAHGGHAALLGVWVAVVGVVLAHGHLRAARVPGRPEPSGPLPIGVWTAAAGSLSSGGLHLLVTREHFAEATLYGVFFLVLGVAQVVWALVVVARPTPTLLLAGAAASVAVVALWLVTRTIAIPLGPAAGETEAFGLTDLLSSGAELVCAVAAVLALRAVVRRTGAVVPAA